MFADEFVGTLTRLAVEPLLGAPYEWDGPFIVRRVRLLGSRYHVYHSFESGADVVKVRAVWHAVRGSGPRL